MRELRAAAVAIVALTLALGLAYPLAMTGVSQVAFGDRADGDPALLGRSYAGCAGCFRSRPSVTGYDPDATAFNNQGPNQQALADQLRGSVRRYLEREGRYTPGLTVAGIPSDAVTTSASGLDPHISRANARIQANRVAAVLRIPAGRVRAAIDRHTTINGAVDVRALNDDLGAER